MFLCFGLLVSGRSRSERKGVDASGEWEIVVDVCIQVLLVGRCTAVERERVERGIVADQKQPTVRGLEVASAGGDSLFSSA